VAARHKLKDRSPLKFKKNKYHTESRKKHVCFRLTSFSKKKTKEHFQPSDIEFRRGPRCSFYIPPQTTIADLMGALRATGNGTGRKGNRRKKGM